MVACGLDGEICIAQHTCIVLFADSFTFRMRIDQGARLPCQLKRVQHLTQSYRRRVVLYVPAYIFVFG
jgi:hypothetical protein